MRTLFEMTDQGTGKLSHVLSRPSVRGIIARDGRILMVESRKYHYWKFPGGGMEKGESMEETLVREVREEAGRIVIPESIREYGNVIRRERSDKFEDTLFLQDNYYFFCDVENCTTVQDLDDYERDENFTPYFIDPETAISDNMDPDHGPKERNMIRREAMVLEMLIEEGYLD